MVKVNGNVHDAAGKTIAEFLRSTDYNLKRIAVERNGEIIPKVMYEQIILQDGDSIEIVSFVGGG